MYIKKGLKFYEHSKCSHDRETDGDEKNAKYNTCKIQTEEIVMKRFFLI